MSTKGKIYRIDVYEKSEEICNYYKNGLGLEDIKKLFNCSTDIIKKILKQNNIKIRSRRHGSIKKSRTDAWERAQEICRRYVDGDTIVDLCAEIDCSSTLITTILLENNIEIRPCGPRPRY